MAIPTAHTMVNIPSGNTETNVFWRCSTCHASSGFNRPGIGTPSATETEFPEDIDNYLGGECPGAPPVPETITLISKLETIKGSSDADARKLWYIMEQTDENSIPINHPKMRAGLMYLEYVGALAIGRADEIITAATPAA